MGRGAAGAAGGAEEDASAAAPTRVEAHMIPAHNNPQSTPQCSAPSQAQDASAPLRRVVRCEALLCAHTRTAACTGMDSAPYEAALCAALLAALLRHALSHLQHTVAPT
jgi:hypothetical protein